MGARPARQRGNTAGIDSATEKQPDGNVGYQLPMDRIFKQCAGMLYSLFGRNDCFRDLVQRPESTVAGNLPSIRVHYQMLPGLQSLQSFDETGWPGRVPVKHILGQSLCRDSKLWQPVENNLRFGCENDCLVSFEITKRFDAKAVTHKMNLAFFPVMDCQREDSIPLGECGARLTLKAFEHDLCIGPGPHRDFI